MKLSQKVGKVIAVNPRKEHHGEQLALAVDVKVEVNCAAEDLDQFDASLKGFLFGQHGPRFPELGSVSWGREYERSAVRLDDIKLNDATVRKISFLPEQGESVKLTFLVTLYPAEDAVGHLANLIQEDVVVNVEQTQVDLVDKIKGEEREPEAA